MSQKDIGQDYEDEEEAVSEDDDRGDPKFKKYKSPGESIGL